MADEWLGVAQLLTPEELVNPKADELSMMTYLAQFRKAKVKEGAPIQTENQNTQMVSSGMEPFEPLLTKDAADDQKQSEEAERNIELWVMCWAENSSTLHLRSVARVLDFML